MNEHESRVKAAIASAEAEAGSDNREFLRALNRHFSSPRSSEARLRAAIPIHDANKQLRDYHIYEDPRYLANARALARRNTVGLRVIGGALTPANDFLDCVAVGSDSQWGCTGTLIAANVVVTAGHCVDYATRIFIGADVTQPGKIVRVKRKVRNPQYHKSKHNDLMVLVLEQKVEGVKPRKIAAKSLTDAATDGRVVGFGATDPTGHFGYGKKRFVDVPVASNACKGKVAGKDDKTTYGCDPGYELVAGRPMLEQDSCNGDSGGPFYLAKNGDWVVAGATSRATDGAMHGCGDGGVYVRLDKYRAWIDAIPGVTLP